MKLISKRITAAVEKL